MTSPGGGVRLAGSAPAPTWESAGQGVAVAVAVAVAVRPRGASARVPQNDALRWPFSHVDQVGTSRPGFTGTGFRGRAEASAQRGGEAPGGRGVHVTEGHGHLVRGPSCWVGRLSVRPQSGARSVCFSAAAVRDLSGTIPAALEPPWACHSPCALGSAAVFLSVNVRNCMCRRLSDDLTGTAWAP